ncbi:TPA: hypothetical protein DCW38_04595 [candidate division WOR-3 bacterium]|jgi:hypothetical protein|uniref:Uncharacterized protein n=1 Tax=candidate division WOR-3 bacterium TaxID=2052148 RepID=A0A350HA76_UNCW3|nr:hypothetical protein [candidate division WOR-3 bacterium]
MKKMILLFLLISATVILQAKAEYYRFVELNKSREFVGVQQVVEGEAKKIECFQFKYDKEKRPVEIRSLTKMNEIAGNFAGFGKGISKLKIEYKDSIYELSDSVCNDKDTFKLTEVTYTAYNSLGESVSMRGSVYKIVHSFTRMMHGGKIINKEDFTMEWSNYSKDGLLCEDLYGVNTYYLEFVNEGGIDKVVSTRLDKEGNVKKDKNGVEKIVFQYNDNGQVVYQAYKDVFSNNINSAYGYCEIRTARADSNELTIKTDYFFDKDGNPVPNSIGVYGVKYFYDLNGYLISYLNLDSKGKPMADKNGLAFTRSIRDNYFYIIKNEYFTSVKDSIKKAPPQLKVEGVPMFFLEKKEYKYDSKGFIIEADELDKIK